jgi:hypothetical protein
VRSATALDSTLSPHAPTLLREEAPTAAERVLASELEARGEASDALSMMVSSVARMVQAGRSCDSRWKAS